MANNPTQHTDKNKQPRSPNSPNQFGGQEGQNRQATGLRDQSLDQDQQTRRTSGQGEQFDQNDQTRATKGQRDQSGSQMAGSQVADRSQNEQNQKKNPGGRKGNC